MFIITIIIIKKNITNVLTKVGPLTNRRGIHCKCTHMTTFAGGWVVVPNTIDWNFVFSNMDFFKNPTLYITEIVIFVVYIVTVIWARYKDKKDLEMVGYYRVYLCTTVSLNGKQCDILDDVLRKFFKENLCSFQLSRDFDSIFPPFYNSTCINIFMRQY